MPRSISQRELRTDSGAVMRRVEQGESFVVTRNGVPVADLTPHQDTAAAPDRFVAVDRIAAALRTVESWDADRFRRELGELDDLVDDTDVDRWARPR